MISRTDRSRELAPDLVADVVFYSTEAGGKRIPARPGYGCPCMVSKATPLQGFDARLCLGETPLYPGQRRRIGFAFLTSEGAAVMRDARRFFLWDGQFIGEATVADGTEVLSPAGET